ncbi:phosphorylase family protein [Beggiatoa sp. PS]|nr:phosphorylase family protein [Beggiatoa sp. PS]
MLNKPELINQESADVIIITALSVEFKAVIEHLQNITEVTHPEGTIYEVGKFFSENQDWDVAVVEIGSGNPIAALETERAVAYFKPSYVFFVGVAGGLKDVDLGDVVAVNKVYGFESGKAEQKFKPRSEFGESTDSLVKRAKAISRKDNWTKRIKGIQTSNNLPNSFVGHIAAGEKVVASTKSPIYKFLQDNFSDALAVEMESIGFLKAIHANSNSQVNALVVRGISDMIDGKSKADASGSQKIASSHAAAFAFEVLAKLKKTGFNDWQQLRDSSKIRWKTIADTIGGSVRLPRTTNYEQIVDKLQQCNAVCILGESGSGKSVLLRRIAEQYAKKTTVIWLDATLFDVSDLEQLSRINLELTHSWQTLADNVAEKTVLVILDGLDQLYQKKSLANLAVFVSTLQLKQTETPFRVLASCQPQRWDTIQRELLKHDAGDIWQISMLENPTWLELEPLTKKFPQLNVLLRREHLHRVLLRPKILDLLACSLSNNAMPDTRHWTGESDFIEWFWKTEIADKSQQGAMRESMLCRLAEQQATQLTHEISLHTFATADLDILSTLEKDKICYRKTGRIGFSHDLYADWSRQRLLLSESGNPKAFLVPLLESPVWHRAIMLFGLNLLERQENIETWESLLTVSDSLADLMLEALIYAADAETMLAKVWNILQTYEGKWLRRLLERFLYIATEPNPNIMHWAKENKFNEIAASTVYRWPRPSFWVPVIRFLSSQQSICIELAPTELAKIIHTWLALTPKEIICRAEAAQIALALGWKTLRHQQHHRILDPWPPTKNEDFAKTVYRAVLAAVYDTPDAVFEFAFCACGCKPPTEPFPPIESEESPTKLLPPKFTQSSTIPSLLSKSVPISPWPDAPKWPVDSKFQSVFLEEINAIYPLIASNPKIVAKLILALCVKHKNKRNYNSDCEHIMRSYDLASFLNYYWYPPFYDRGPFLSLLMVSPETGLDVIIKLVNIATYCWLDCERWQQKLSKKETSLTIHIAHDVEQQEWIGDQSWLFVYRASPHAPHILVCALMALEKWFYERLDKNEPIEEFIDGILGSTCSLALVGVLIAVAKRKPSLFMGSLKVFLSVPEIYQFDLYHNMKDEHHQMMGWDCLQHTDIQIEQAKAWHDIKRRHTRLEDIGVHLMLTEPSLQSFFADIREAWQKRLKNVSENDPNKDILSSLLLQFNPAHWKSSENGNHWDFQPPEHFLTQTISAEEKLKDQRLLLWFPMHCRKILDGEEPVTDELLQQTRKQGEHLLNLDVEKFLGEEKFIRSSHDIACALAALAVCLPGNWLDDWPNWQTWCRKILLDAIFNPPSLPVFDTPESFNNSAWDRSCANALPILWAASPNDKKFREAVAHLCCNRHYETVQYLFESTAKMRDKLGDDFLRLEHLVIRWSVIQHRMLVLNKTVFGKEKSTREQLNKELHKLIDKFVSGKLSPTTPNLRSLKHTFVVLDPSRIEKIFTYVRRKFTKRYH